jgi:hypothetical protein
MKIRTTCELWSSGIQGARDVPQHRMIDKTRPVWMVRDQDTVQPNMDHFKTVMNYYRAIQRAFVTTSETRHLLIDYFLDVTSQTDSSCTKKKSNRFISNDVRAIQWWLLRVQQFPSIHVYHDAACHYQSEGSAFGVGIHQCNHREGGN